MARLQLASWIVLTWSMSASGADPKPLWELPAAPKGEAASVAWLSYSPDGKSIVAVSAKETKSASLTTLDYVFHLRVWDAQTRKERFNAPLGTSRSFHWGDDLASFPTDDTVMTGGQTMTVRNLDTGSQTTAFASGGIADFAVWSVPDLKETFFLRREAQTYNQPVELVYRGQNINPYDEMGFRRPVRSDTGTMQAKLDPPREGLRTELVAMNAGRTRLVASFRDESGARDRRHALVMYRVRTMEQFELETVAVVANPHPGPVTAAAFARNGRTLATGGEDGSISLWDVSDGTLTRPRSTLSGLADHRVYAIAFNHDWRYLAAVTWDKVKPNLIVIDTDSGRPLKAIKLERQTSNVAWHPDGRTLLSVGASGVIQAWEVAPLVK